MHSSARATPLVFPDAPGDELFFGRQRGQSFGFVKMADGLIEAPELRRERAEMAVVRGGDAEPLRRQLRHVLGYYLLLGLEFFIAADIIDTLMNRSRRSFDVTSLCRPRFNLFRSNLSQLATHCRSIYGLTSAVCL